MDRRHEPRIPFLWMTLIAGLLAAPLFALAQQNAPAAISDTAPDTAPGVALTPGAALLSQPRISRLLGRRVYNNRDEAIGAVEEVLFVLPSTLATPGPVAIIQVGGLLGMGGHLVSVPLGDLRWHAGRERITLPDATKEALRARPAFDYRMLHNP